MKVNLLPDSVINIIAAGEVVDRPASVVKELVENSLDAGSKSISVLLENGGRSLIQVSDDGHGMAKQDALMSFQRHATSKLQSETDLFSIASHGFRGEALPSIASVSKVEMLTRQECDETGWEIKINAGEIKSVAPVACKAGTTVRVKRIFFNTPVRRKFLRSDSYEATRVRMLLRNMSLANPECSFQLKENGRITLFVRPHENFLARVRSQYRGTVMKFSETFDDVSVSGVVAHPAMAESDTEGFIFLVNNRLVRDRMLGRAVREGFHFTLKPKEFPLGVMSIQLPADKIDVNIHPQKTEIRFLQGQVVFGIVRDVIHKALNRFQSPVQGDWQKKVTPAIQPTERLQTTTTSMPTSGSAAVRTGSPELAPPVQPAVAADSQAVEVSERKPQSVISRMPGESVTQVAEPEALPFAAGFSQMRYLGQVSACFLLFDDAGELVVIDMHAAHERVNYNRIMDSVQGQKCNRQAFLVPFAIHVGCDGQELLKDRQEAFGNLGFDISFDDDGNVIVHSEPVLPLKGRRLGRSDLRSLFQEASSVDFWISPEYGYQELLASLVARRACHSSIRSGDTVSVEEARALCSDLDSLDLGAACPHGRPVSVRFSKQLMSDWFGRD